MERSEPSDKDPTSNGKGKGKNKNKNKDLIEKAIALAEEGYNGMSGFVNKGYKMSEQMKQMYRQLKKQIYFHISLRVLALC